MQVLIIIIFSAFLFAAAIGNPLINCINKKNRGKVINALGPKSHIVKQGTPEMGGFIFITPTVTITLLSGCLLEPGLAKATPEDRFQFLRVGYFCADNKDFTPDHLVFNRAVSLKDSYKPGN